MSSCDVKLSRRAAFLRLSTVAAAGLLVGACGFQPVYRTAPGQTPVRAQLTGVYIEDAPDRPTQVLRNELLFLFGQNASTPREGSTHTLKMTTRGYTQKSIVSRTGYTTARIYVLEVSYSLIDNATKQAVVDSRTSAQSAFDILDQQYANIRAERDAENRAARDVARKINDQIGAYFAATR